MLVKNQIKKLQAMNPEDNIAVDMWCTEDVAYRDGALTRDQCDRVINMMESEHNCDIGLNWDIMDIWINWVKAESEVKNEN